MPEPLALDTPLPAEARQIALFRERTEEERLALMFELCAFALAASRSAIRRAHPDLPPIEQARLLTALLFGADRARQVQRVPSVEGAMTIPAAILPVAEVFEQLQVSYFISGSIASTAYSLPRTTNDVDVVAALRRHHVQSFVNALSDAYYVDHGAVVEAIAQHSSFNMTHQDTGINVDVFIPAGRQWDHVQFTRVRAHVLPGTTRAVNLASPEDVLLNKLAWYESGNRVSDQQWRDVQGILRVQGEALDLAYMRHWAASLQLGKLLEAAIRGERPLPGAAGGPEQQPLF